MTKSGHPETTQWYEKSFEELAKDLHDGVSHQLVTILWKMEFLKHVEDGRERNIKIDQLSEEMRNVINDLHQIIYGVKPVLIDEIGLVEAVCSWISSRLNSQNIQFELFQECESLDLSRFEAGQVYRILQEGVNNIIQHARAKRVTLTVKEEGTNFVLVLCDDGKGFDDSIPLQTGLGLQTMRERAQMIQGELRMETEREAGTTIKLLIPRKGGDFR